MTTLMLLSTLLLLAVLLGSMVFFSFVMAPLIFIKLETAVAARFIRAVFPWYYLLTLLLAGAVTPLLLADSLVLALCMTGVALAALYLRIWLMPRLNRWRDKGKAGDRAAQARFDAGHRWSVWINAAQLVTVMAVLLLFALRNGF